MEKAIEKSKLLDALIKHYSEVINHIETLDNMDEIKRHLYKTNTYSGVCCYLFTTYKILIIHLDDDWIKKYVPQDSVTMWGKRVIYGESKAEIIELLQLRLNNLNTEKSLTT